ncbi:VTT domain-containing protein [Candidatus Woesearchaeota archaeon]|nr:VTT domain-containing protein [Candidatus Woesearchaeota archaeon]
MFGDITTLILEGIRTHGILAVIIGVAIETIIVPLPSPLIVMAAGYILIPPDSTLFAIVMNALWISVVAGLAQTIGSFLLYFIGYYGGKPFIDKFEKLHGVSWKEIETFQKKFSGKKEEVTLFLLRALPIMPLSVISGVAGIMEMDFKQYTLATFLGVIPRNLILAILGFTLGEFYHILAGSIDHAESIMTAIIIFMILAYIAGHKLGIFDKMRKHILK